MEIRALIIDDEPPARARVARLLEKHSPIEVIGECGDGLQALQMIENLKPDLIFLDIQMPELNGFDVLNQLPDTFQPYIVFTTAFDQYALEAFEHHAMDYLLKPLDRERFDSAVEKVITQMKGKNAEGFSEKLKNLLGEYERSVAPEKKTFLIKQHGVQKVIRADEIYWVESEGNYVNLHSYQGEFLYRCSMGQMEDELKDKQFLRIHRSLLINTLHLAKSHYLNNETFKFTFNNEMSLTSGRSYKNEIQKFLLQANYIRQF